MTTSSETDILTFRLPDVLDLKAAGPLAANFLALRGADLIVDASGVQRLGAQCLQVLISALSTWHADESAIDFINPSPEFTEGLDMLGVSSEQFLNQNLAG